MIKCNYFSKTVQYEPGTGNVVYSPMYLFNEWDQTDVDSIIHIETIANEKGECVKIIVFYKEKEKLNAIPPEYQL